MSAGFRSSTASKTYSLLVNLGRSTKCIVEITILSSGLVDAVQLTLEVPEIRLAQRPCLCKRKLLKLVSDRQQLVVDVLECWVDSPLPVELLAFHLYKGDKLR